MEKVKFQCGVFMKEVIRQLARKSQRRQDAPAADSVAATGFDGGDRNCQTRH